MEDPRWLGAHGAAGDAPPVGSFQRRASDNTMLVFAGAAPMLPPRVLGSDPDREVGPVRTRNSANSSVYTLHLTDIQTRRPARGTVRVPVPVIGEIAAGRYDASVALFDYLDYEHGLELDRALLHSDSGVFALRVRGTSMTHVGIQPGDLVVIHKQDTAEDGDFVVARLADSTDPAGYVTLKRFYRRKDHVFLQSATADKDPIRLFPQKQAGGRSDRDRVKIQGKVLVVIRTGT
jgi:SOS-response transcriptional repressor LexA